MAAPAGPTSAAREPQLRSVSARSILLTVLGEYVHPDAAPVWTATLVDALGLLDVEEKAARQALARTAAAGLLTSSRHGRRVRWALTPTGRDLLQEGTERIYGFMRGDRAWDGRWLVLTVSIPESQRQLRHRLRRRLSWLGLGSPGSGLWIGTDTARLAEVHAVVSELGLDDQAFAWTGPAASIGSERRLVDEAWDLDEVEQTYLEFLDEVERRAAPDDRSAFVAQVELVEAWRRFPFLDPALPADLLDHDWPGPRAADVFHDRHARWDAGARRTWEQLRRAAEPAG